MAASIINVLPGRLDEGEGLAEGAYRLPLIGNDGRPLSISAAGRFTNTLFREAEERYSEVNFRVSVEAIADSGLEWRYYAPFYLARPLNIDVDGDSKGTIQRVERPVRLIVAGSRAFENYAYAQERLDFLCRDIPPASILVISGTAKGADQIGEKWAEERNLPVRRFEASWDNLEAPRAIVGNNRWGQYNAHAGKDRNCYMAMVGTHLVAFPAEAEISPGTLDMIKQARSLGRNTRVVSPPVTQKGRNHAVDPR